MQLYVARHGETDYNRLGLCNDDPGREVFLTARGRAQAEALSLRLRAAPVERIITSELPRTRQTADIVNRFHRVPIEANPLLNDIRSGFDGAPVTDYFKAIQHDPLRARVNGGESLLDYKARVTRFIEWLQQQPEKCILVVAHEETLRIFESYFEAVADADLRRLQFENCAVLRYQL